MSINRIIRIASSQLTMLKPNWRSIRYFVYFFLFLIGFAAFLPVPFAPLILHDFYSSIGSILFIPIFLLLLFWSFLLLTWNCYQNKGKSVLVEALNVPALFFVLIVSFPIFNDWRDRATVWLNDGRQVENFVNPFPGMKFIDCRKVDRLYDVYFRHNGFSVEADMLVYAPKSDAYETGRGTKIYNKHWYLTRSDSGQPYEGYNDCLK